MEQRASPHRGALLNLSRDDFSGAYLIFDPKLCNRISYDLHLRVYDTREILMCSKMVVTATDSHLRHQNRVPTHIVQFTSTTLDCILILMRLSYLFLHENEKQYSYLFRAPVAM